MTNGRNRGPRRVWLPFVMAALLGMPAAAQTGHQLFVGHSRNIAPPTSVPFAPSEFVIIGDKAHMTVYLNRAPDAGTNHPTAISFDLVWDPAVLAIASPADAAPHPLLGSWYGKQSSIGFAEVNDGVLVVSIAGGVTHLPDSFDTRSTEVSTYHNQLPEIAPETGATQQNPFPLITVEFDVVGSIDDSTTVGFEAVALSGQDAQPLPTQGAVGTLAVIRSGDFPDMPPGAPAAGAWAVVLLTLALAACSLRPILASK